MISTETLQEVLGSNGELLWAIGGIFLFCLVADLVRSWHRED